MQLKAKRFKSLTTGVLENNFRFQFKKFTADECAYDPSNQWQESLPTRVRGGLQMKKKETVQLKKITINTKLQFRGRN